MLRRRDHFHFVDHWHLESKDLAADTCTLTHACMRAFGHKCTQHMFTYIAKSEGRKRTFFCAALAP